jgi:hypothetical protein
MNGIRVLYGSPFVLLTGMMMAGSFLVVKGVVGGRVFPAFEPMGDLFVEDVEEH